MDVEILARVQFALTIAFHYIYPPLSIGLGVILVMVGVRSLITRDPRYRTLARFWTRVFALTFSVGVATGIVMEFEFGTNWANYSRFVGDVFGSALASEAIFAFFLESGFLAVLLFGWDRVSPRMHFLSTLFVCLGAHFSAVWIVVANSWMQTPAGFHVVGEGRTARAEITDFWAMVFNPSSLDRLAHTLVGAWQAGAFLVVSVGAYYILRGRHLDFARTSLRFGLLLALVATSLSIVTGDRSSTLVARHQPSKFAAMEGHWDDAPLGLRPFGWVNPTAERTYGPEVPGFGSWLIHGDASRPVAGLRGFAPGDRPPIQLTFQAFHLMVAIGILLFGLAWLSAFYWWRGRLFDTRWLLRALVASVLGPQIANQLGWVTAEVGRQPWIVWGLMRTPEGLSVSVSAAEVWVSLVLFSVIYVLLFLLFIYLLDRKIKHGPEAPVTEPASGRARAD